jgi:Uma2 family endonuclease
MGQWGTRAYHSVSRGHKGYQRKKVLPNAPGVGLEGPFSPGYDATRLDTTEAHPKEPDPMATAPRRRAPHQNGYPTSDGRPVAETDWHRELMFHLIAALHAFYAAVRDVYVSGNLLLFYERGNKRKHVSPDVFVVKGVPKHQRPNYLLWEEGKGPDVIFELTSSSTKREDLVKKFGLYRDVLKVREYFLFDPLGDYLDPPLQGFRLAKGDYVPIRPVHGRLPSKVLGLHLDRDGKQLRLYNPLTGEWLPTPEEAVQRAEAEVERLRRELDALRRGNGQS